jgi:hypothetical protein
MGAWATTSFKSSHIGITTLLSLSILTSSVMMGQIPTRNMAPVVPYSQTLLATGGTPPYTWSLPSGRLPGGFVLSPDGVISGTADPANQPDGFLDPLLLNSL